ncbi:uncharacterized protein [Rutidosis leptorrhynchoides]|uniref:uncharacterized protein n=1 Tax=Rutidosis leptorrhynchoides TaxID=125765 RepID=UPI003A9A0D4E
MALIKMQKSEDQTDAICACYIFEITHEKRERGQSDDLGHEWRLKFGSKWRGRGWQISFKNIDVIGHVVENEKIRKIVKPDKTMKLLIFVLEDLEKKRINCILWDAFVEKLNEAILDATTLNKINSCYFTIEILGISNNFQGTKIFVNLNLPEDVEYSQKSKMQVRVRDRTGATSLMLFDRMVKLLICKSATDLINPSNKVENKLSLCLYFYLNVFVNHLIYFLIIIREKSNKNLLAEFEEIVDKELLFKFGIIEEDLFSDWDVTYTVKRVTSDEDLIKRFKDKHFIRDTDREDSDMTPTTDKSNKRK